MRSYAEVRSCFYCNSNALWERMLWVSNSFMMILGSVARECIMKIPYKVISVWRRETHKGSALNYELNFVNTVANFLKLLNSILNLYIRIISCSYGSHACRLIACIRLCWVFKIWVWTTWTIYTNISCCCYMWTSVWLAHDCNNCNTWGSSNRLGF